MTRITFPIDLFMKEKRDSPQIFTTDAMIAVCTNKYFTNYLFSQTLGCQYNLKKAFNYHLSDFEISHLGTIPDEEKDYYFGNNYYSIPYDFCLSTKKRRYKGVIEIKTIFKNNNSLEKSYFITEITVSPEVDLNINFETLLEEKALKVAEEFLENMWKDTFKILKKYEICRSKKATKKNATEYILTTELTRDISISNKVLELINDEAFCLNDSVTDLFHIIFNQYVHKEAESRFLYISADEILEIKEKKKNINSKGNRGGFKVKLKKKIHLDLAFLSALDILYFQEIEKDRYSISFNSKMFSKNNLIYPISKKILSYNPKTQFYQKRIGEYLSFQKFVSAKNNSLIRVETLLNLIKENTSSLKPSIIRDNLEKALDELCQDKVISDWEYKKINENELQGKNWLIKYNKLNINIGF